MNGRLLASWLVHLLTASGAVVAFMAVLAIAESDARAALLWLLPGLFIDGVDGPLARTLQVQEHTPMVDGATLDLVVDYLTYVFVPAYFFFQFDMFPQGTDLAFVFIILISSLYLFSNRNMKSPDNYFVGFPSIWNVALIYLFVFQASAVVVAAVVLGLTILTFVPVKTVHPMRVKDFRMVSRVLVLGWFALSIYIVTTLPEPPAATVLFLWVATALWFVGVGVWRTLGP